MTYNQAMESCFQNRSVRNDLVNEFRYIPGFDQPFAVKVKSRLKSSYIRPSYFVVMQCYAISFQLKRVQKPTRLNALKEQEVEYLTKSHQRSVATTGRGRSWF